MIIFHHREDIKYKYLDIWSSCLDSAHTVNQQILAAIKLGVSQEKSGLMIIEFVASPSGMLLIYFGAFPSATTL